MSEQSLSPRAVVNRTRGLVVRNLPHPVRRAIHDTAVRRRYVGLSADDLLFVSFPKSGSTWLRFVLAQAITGEPMDFDRIQQASPPLGQHRGGRAILPRGGHLVKSHELPPLGGRAPSRVIYLLRDGRDVAVSYRTHLERRGFRIEADLDTFVERFAEGAVGTYGSWQDHVAAWTRVMAASKLPSALVRYEDLRTDPTGALLAAGVDLQLDLDPDRVTAAFAANTPEAMRAKEQNSVYLAQTKVGEVGFVGSAKTGGWRESVSPAAAAVFERSARTQLLAHGYQLEASATDPGS